MPETAAKYKSISVVATIYDDCDAIKKLVEEIEVSVKSLTENYEIILVDDYSLDTSRQLIKTICEKNSHVKAVFLSKNYGQQIAMSAGISYAQGDVVIIMDGDMQNPPDKIPELVKELAKGYDIVYTVSTARNNLLDKLFSQAFWFLIDKVLKVEVVKNQLMMKAMTKETAQKFIKYQETNRTIAGIVRDISSNYSVLKVANRKRISGHSHYTYLKKFLLMIDIVISLTAKPLDFMIILSSLVFVFASVLSFYHLFTFLFLDAPLGYTSIILSIVFFGSLNTIMIGFIGKYIASIYRETKMRPLFNVEKTFNISIK